MKLPVVAIVGRPNAGKSTLFNYVLRKKVAITSDIAGTTRDRLCELLKYDDKSFILVDTGGIEDADKDSVIDIGIQDHVREACGSADIIVFMIDILNGLSIEDKKIAKALRSFDKDIVLVASKSDRQGSDLEALNLSSLGLGDARCVSVKQGRGIDDLFGDIAGRLPKVSPNSEDKSVSIALVGRPNVGKSSLINRLVGEDLQIVSDIPGTTRDANSFMIKYFDRDVRFVDTAGVRRPGKVQAGIEKYSVLRSINAIAQSDVAALVIDAEEGVTASDMKMASIIRESARGVMLVVNKWDKVEKDDMTMVDYGRYLYRKFSFLDYAPCVFTSAVTGQRATKILDIAIDISDKAKVRIPTSRLNACMEDVLREHFPARKNSKKKRPKVYYSTQSGTNPIEIVLFVNATESFHHTYFKYLERKVRSKFDLDGVGLMFMMREKGASESERVGGRTDSKRVLRTSQNRLNRWN